VVLEPRNRGPPCTLGHVCYQRGKNRRGRASISHLRPLVSPLGSPSSCQGAAEVLVSGEGPQGPTQPTHTGRKLHLWFTPQAKAARPARTDCAAPNGTPRPLSLSRASCTAPDLSARAYPHRVSSPPPELSYQESRLPAPCGLTMRGAPHHVLTDVAKAKTRTRCRHPPSAPRDRDNTVRSQAGVHPGLIETRTSFEPTRGRHVFLYAAGNLDRTRSGLQAPLLLR